jgi:O-antigen ligase
VVLLVAVVPLVQILPDIPVLSSLMMLLGGLTLVAFLSQRLLNHEPFRFTSKPLYIALLLFLALMLFGQISLSATVDRNYFLTYFQLAALIFLCDQLLNSRRKIDLLMLSYVLAVQISALVALYDFLQNLDASFSYAYRPRGLVGNANGLGIHLSVAMVMLYYYFQNSASRTIRLLALIAFLFSGVMLFVSGSRGALIFFLPVLLYQILYVRRNRYLIGMLLLFIVALLIVNSVPTEYLERMLQIPTVLQSASDTVGLRLRLWNIALRLWEQSPVFGIGPGMFYFYTSQNFSLLGRSGLAAHNMYITFLTENGLIGLALYLWIAAISVGLLFKALSWARRVQPSWVPLIVTWQSVLFIELLNGTKANGGYDKIHWLCFGISLVLWRLMQEQLWSQSLSFVEQRDLNAPKAATSIRLS